MFLTSLIKTSFNSHSITYYPAAVIEEKLKEGGVLKPPQEQVPSMMPSMTQQNTLALVGAQQVEGNLSPMPSYAHPEPRVVDIIRHPEFGYEFHWNLYKSNRPMSEQFNEKA